MYWRQPPVPWVCGAPIWSAFLEHWVGSGLLFLSDVLNVEGRKSSWWRNILNTREEQPVVSSSQCPPWQDGGEIFPMEQMVTPQICPKMNWSFFVFIILCFKIKHFCVEIIMTLSLISYCFPCQRYIKEIFGAFLDKSCVNVSIYCWFDADAFKWLQCWKRTGKLASKSAPIQCFSC